MRLLIAPGASPDVIHRVKSQRQRSSIAIDAAIPIQNFASTFTREAWQTTFADLSRVLSFTFIHPRQPLRISRQLIINFGQKCDIVRSSFFCAPPDGPPET